MKEFMEQIAKGAGEILMENFGKLKHIEHKGARDIVTNVDKLVEEFIISKIKEKFPEHAILGEESGKQGDSEKMWIIDPLDGTKNYSIRNPFFNVSIAYAENKDVKHAAIYIPFLDEFFYAEKGKGATLNNKPIQVSDVPDLKNSFVQFCNGMSDKAIENISKIFTHIRPKVLALRQQGAGAMEMCYVAAGRAPIYFMSDFESPWDVAAGTLIVREAGGKVTNFKGEEFQLEDTNLLSTNGKVHNEALKEINEALQI